MKRVANFLKVHEIPLHPVPADEVPSTFLIYFLYIFNISLHRRMSERGVGQRRIPPRLFGKSGCQPRALHRRASRGRHKEAGLRRLGIEAGRVQVEPGCQSHPLPQVMYRPKLSVEEVPKHSFTSPVVPSTVTRSRDSASSRPVRDDRSEPCRICAPVT